MAQLFAVCGRGIGVPLGEVTSLQAQGRLETKHLDEQEKRGVDLNRVSFYIEPANAFEVVV